MGVPRRAPGNMDIISAQNMFKMMLDNLIVKKNESFRQRRPFFLIRLNASTDRHASHTKYAPGDPGKIASSRLSIFMSMLKTFIRITQNRFKRIFEKDGVWEDQFSMILNVCTRIFSVHTENLYKQNSCQAEILLTQKMLDVIVENRGL